MRKKDIYRLIGEKCKIVTEGPGKDKVHVIIGIIKDIDSKKKLLVAESNHGLFRLNLRSILSIIPKRDNKA